PPGALLLAIPPLRGDVGRLHVEVRGGEGIPGVLRPPPHGVRASADRERESQTASHPCPSAPARHRDPPLSLRCASGPRGPTQYKPAGTPPKGRTADGSPSASL